MFPIKEKEDFQKLNKLLSLKGQVRAVRLQDKLGEQNYHQNAEKLHKPLIDTSKDTAENLTKTIMETYIKSNKAIENLNYKLLEIKNDKGIFATFLISPLSKITNPENTTQFIIVKDSSSNRVTDLLIINTIPITSHVNLLIFRDTGEVLELKEDLLKMITHKNYIVDLVSLAGKKLMYDFAKEIHFDVRSQGRKSTRDHTLINMLKSPGLMVSASGISTIFVPSDPDEL